MKAAEFLKLCVEDIDGASYKLQGALGYDPACYVGELYIDDLSRDRRADAGLEREAWDALFKLAPEKGLGVNLGVYSTGMFWLNIWSLGYSDETIIHAEHSNLSWLMAAALVELTTEGK